MSAAKERCMNATDGTTDGTTDDTAAGPSRAPGRRSPAT
jgi:hypothetical protein